MWCVYGEERELTVSTAKQNNTQYNNNNKVRLIFFLNHLCRFWSPSY